MRQVDGLVREKPVINAGKKKVEKPSLRVGNLFIKLKNLLTFLVFFLLTILLLYLAIGNFNFLSERVNLIRQFYSGDYLILFQNNSELRPGGGFIGSYATVKTKLFRVDQLKINTNIYKNDDKYDYVLQIQPPKQFTQTVLGTRKYWAMRDSNWSPDFPTSADQVAWFYNQEGGQPVDGVVALNASVVVDILKIVGPIEIPQKQVVVNSDNFFDVLFNQIEVAYYQDPANLIANEPKEILNDLYPILMARIKEKQYRLEVLKLILKEFSQRQIQFYSSNHLIENAFKWFDIAGEVKKVNNLDYLYINNADLAGNKSSFNVEQKVVLNTFIDTNGVVTDSLNITRTHHGTGEWPDGDNFNYQRIIVPKDSILIKADYDGKDISGQIDITQENDKTVFGYWFNTLIGETKVANISYQLAQKLPKVEDYSLYWQKQSGVISDYLEVIVNSQKILQEYTDKDREIK